MCIRQNPSQKLVNMSNKYYEAAVKKAAFTESHSIIIPSATLSSVTSQTVSHQINQNLYKHIYNKSK